MRHLAGFLLFFAACGVASAIPVAAKTPSSALTKRCTDASGFTARAVNDPAYKTSKIYANAKELAYINRCVSTATGQKTTVGRIQAGAAGAQALQGTLPVPRQYPLMRGDAALWDQLTMSQQRRAMLFLQSGSTIRSSLMGD